MSAVSAEPPKAQIERDDHVIACAQTLGHGARLVQLDPVTLAVIDREREAVEAVAARDRQRGR